MGFRVLGFGVLLVSPALGDHMVHGLWGWVVKMGTGSVEQRQAQKQSPLLIHHACTTSCAACLSSAVSPTKPIDTTRLGYHLIYQHIIKREP